MRLLIFFCLLIPVSGQCQRAVSVIKTQPLKIFVAAPSIAYERFINNTFSLEIEAKAGLKEWETAGGEWDFGSFYNSKGGSLGLSTRIYLDNNVRPKGWYAAFSGKYNYVTIKNFHRVYFNGLSATTGDLTKSGPEFGFLMGKQFVITDKLTMEAIGGLGIFLETRKFVINDQSANLSVDKLMIEDNSKPQFYLLWTIGYAF